MSLSLDGLRRTQLRRLAPRFDAAGFALLGPIPPWLGAGLALDLSACAERRHGADGKREARKRGVRGSSVGIGRWLLRVGIVGEADHWGP